jgi:hypothetical protein
VRGLRCARNRSARRVLVVARSPDKLVDAVARGGHRAGAVVGGGWGRQAEACAGWERL